jgi:hypothetical protein
MLILSQGPNSNRIGSIHHTAIAMLPQKVGKKVKVSRPALFSSQHEVGKEIG